MKIRSSEKITDLLSQFRNNPGKTLVIDENGDPQWSEAQSGGTNNDPSILDSSWNTQYDRDGFSMTDIRIPRPWAFAIKDVPDDLPYNRLVSSATGYYNTAGNLKYMNDDFIYNGKRYWVEANNKALNWENVDDPSINGVEYGIITYGSINAESLYDINATTFAVISWDVITFYSKETLTMVEKIEMYTVVNGSSRLQVHVDRENRKFTGVFHDDNTNQYFAAHLDFDTREIEYDPRRISSVGVHNVFGYNRDLGILYRQTSTSSSLSSYDGTTVTLGSSSNIAYVGSIDGVLFFARYVNDTSMYIFALYPGDTAVKTTVSTFYGLFNNTQLFKNRESGLYTLVATSNASGTTRHSVTTFDLSGKVHGEVYKNITHTYIESYGKLVFNAENLSDETSVILNIKDGEDNILLSPVVTNGSNIVDISNVPPGDCKIEFILDRSNVETVSPIVSNIKHNWAGE